MSFIGARRTRISTRVHEETLTAAQLHKRLHDIQAMYDKGAATTAFEQAQRLSDVVPYDARVLTLAARCAAGCGQHSKAAQFYDRLLFQQDTAEVWAGKAKSLNAMTQFDQTSEAYARAYALSGNDGYIVEKAAVLLKAGHLEKAYQCLEGCSPVTKARSRHQLLEAQILGEIGQKHEAFELAVRASHSNPTARAISLAKMNAPSDVVFLTFCASLWEKPLSASALAELAAHYPAEFPKSARDQLHRLVQDPDVHKAADAHLALFRLCDSEGEGFMALAHLRKYHALLKKGRRREDAALFTQLSRLNYVPLTQSKSRVLPIFITGLPGSGRHRASTLMEKAAGGTSAYPLSLVEPVMMRLLRKLHASRRLEISREEMLELQGELREGLQYAAGNNDVVIDNGPLNFRWSGLIAAALPEARILQMKSDNMSSGWAIHRGGWQHPALKCQHSLGQIGAFQWRSDVLMRRWEQMFPKRVYGFSGDRLWQDNIAQVRAMVLACNLEWSKHCIPTETKPQQDWHQYSSYMNNRHFSQFAMGAEFRDV